MTEFVAGQMIPLKRYLLKQTDIATIYLYLYSYFENICYLLSIFYFLVCCL